MNTGQSTIKAMLQVIRKQAGEAGNMAMHKVKDELLSAAEDLDNAGRHLKNAMEKL